jgi:ribose transport system permease protein
VSDLRDDSAETAAAVSPGGPAAARTGAVSTLRSWTERVALLGALIVVIVVFGVLKPDQFMTGSNFAAILGSQAVLVVLTCALLIPLTVGDYDLSIASTLMLSQMLIGVLNTRHDIPISVLIPLCLVVGALVGFVNGGFIILFGIDSLIVTLGIGTLVSGIVLLISNSETFAGISPTLINPVVVNRFLGVPLEFYYGLIVVAAQWYVFEFTTLGRRLLFVGRGRNVSRLSGLRVNRIRWGSFVASGVIAAGAGILYAGTTGAADPTSGANYLLPAFAAAFLGTTAFFPGRFNPWGSFVAVYFLVTGVTGLALFGLQSWVQDMFYGAALVLAVTLSQLARRREALIMGAG